MFSESWTQQVFTPAEASPVFRIVCAVSFTDSAVLEVPYCVLRGLQVLLGRKVNNNIMGSSDDTAEQRETDHEEHETCEGGLFIRHGWNLSFGDIPGT